MVYLLLYVQKEIVYKDINKLLKAIYLKLTSSFYEKSIVYFFKCLLFAY